MNTDENAKPVGYRTRYPNNIVKDWHAHSHDDPEQCQLAVDICRDHGGEAELLFNRPASSASKEALSDEQIEEEWFKSAGHSISSGRMKGVVVELVRSILAQRDASKAEDS